jgi:adenine-specific DNA-methyltransferase
LLCKELLSESGSIFFQISDKNLHHIREIFDEIFGSENFVSLICFQKVGHPFSSANNLPSKLDFILWYAKDRSKLKFHKLYINRKNELPVGYDFYETKEGERFKLTMNKKEI